MFIGPWSVLLLFILLLSLCMCRSQPLAVCLVQSTVRLYSDHPRIFGLELDYFPSSLMILCCSNASCCIEQISVLPTAPSPPLQNLSGRQNVYLLQVVLVPQSCVLHGVCSPYLFLSLDCARYCVVLMLLQQSFFVSC